MSAGSLLIEKNVTYDYLVDYALRNIWCNPDQDNQHIEAPCRITSATGVLNTVRVMRRLIELPTKGIRYHVFQIGQLHPLLLGLFKSGTGSPIQNEWISFQDAINKRKMVVQLYSDSGVSLPLHECYYMYTIDRDLIIAIRPNAKIPFDYTSEQFYLRVYTNAYFKTARADQSIEYTAAQGMVLNTKKDILDYQYAYEAYAEKDGHVFAYVNGYLVDSLSLLTVNVGDCVWMVYDSTIKRTVTFNVKDLPTFKSVLDSKNKYLLHYSTQSNDMIDYQDDMEIYVLDPLTNNHWRGVYHHRNGEDSCRMVTHRDYSLVVSYVLNFISQLQKEAGTDHSVSIDTAQIQLIIRDAGYARPLVFENNRIKELYKMADSDIQNALLSTNRSIPNWRVETLEASPYTELMRDKSTLFTRELVQNALGYNAVSKLVGDTPSLTKISSNRKVIDVPYGLQYNSTAYEYDSHGWLLGYHYHVSGSTYACEDNRAVLVEMISGKGSYTPDVRCGNDNIPLPATDDYRVYQCTIKKGVYQNDWVDITGSPKYDVVNNTLVWNAGDDISRFLMVRTDAAFLAADLYLTPQDSNLKFTFSEMEKRGNTIKNYVLPFPLGELDIFLNGRPLIEGLDYIVVFPTIVIINKKFLKNPANNNIHWIHVRFTGFCNPDLTRTLPTDTGFIEYGMMSNNNKFDIRDDKVLRIVSNGKLLTRDHLVFAEQSSGLGIINSENGHPYQIRDIVVPLKNLINGNTYDYRAKAQAIDATVSGFLTELVPEPVKEGVSAIAARYEVFSPFIAKVLYAVLSGEIDNNALKVVLTDNLVLSLCKQYESWLKFDLINPDNAYDSRYVIIHPHNHYNVIELDVFQYRFMRKVVALYANGLVELSPFVVLNSES